MFDATVSAQTPENADVIDLVACMPACNVLSGSLMPCLVDASEFIAGHLNRSSMHVTQSVVQTEAAAGVVQHVRAAQDICPCCKR